MGNNKKGFQQKKNNNNTTNYIVIGCGKTGMDTIIYLYNIMKIPINQIYWIISADVWMLLRNNGTPSSWIDALLANNGNEKKARIYLEKQNVLVRLDKNITPTRFRFPVIGKDELSILQSIPNKIRKGRISNINIVNDNNIKIIFEKKKQTTNNNEEEEEKKEKEEEESCWEIS